MRTLKLTVAYDGTRYAGWQVQRNATQTIQAVLQEALRTALGEAVHVQASGRTDAGVHALAQVAHLRTRSPLPAKRLLWSLNGLLPHDIRVREVAEAPAAFHAQFDAVAKRYRYSVVMGPVVLPFDRPYVQQMPLPLNVALIRREARRLLGRHDMAAFQSAGRPVRDSHRTILDIRVTRKGSRLDIEIEADGFLYHMVRRIAGTLLDIGRGRLPPGTIAAMLRTRDPRLGGPVAPARGLCLLRVAYRKH